MSIIEQIQIGLVPMTVERYSELTGLPQGVVDAQVKRGQVPILKIGRRVLINVPKIFQVCLSPGNRLELSEELEG